MDQKTRNEFEHYCALAEIEEDPEEFYEIGRNIKRLLDEKQAFLRQQRPRASLQQPAKPTAAA